MGKDNKHRGNGNGSKERQPPVAKNGQQPLSREDREKKKLNQQKKHEKYMVSKVELAGKDNSAVVKTDTPETGRASGLLNKNDYYITKLREKVVTDKNINPYTAVYLLQMNSKIRDLMNTQNALLCQALGYQSGYDPPWGCEVPQESHEAVLAEMMVLITNHEKMVPLAERVPPPVKEIKMPLAVADRKGQRDRDTSPLEIPVKDSEQIVAAAP
jgi:hypothetical protein